MILENTLTCPYCNGNLKYYDRVKRSLKTKYGKTYVIYLRRFKCLLCGTIHRELTEQIYPYKHYELEMIKGVVEGIITPDIYGFEDYPCEMTMIRWLTQNLHFLL